MHHPQAILHVRAVDHISRSWGSQRPRRWPVSIRERHGEVKSERHAEVKASLVHLLAGSEFRSCSITGNLALATDLETTFSILQPVCRLTAHTTEYGLLLVLAAGMTRAASHDWMERRHAWQSFRTGRASQRAEYTGRGPHQAAGYTEIRNADTLTYEYPNPTKGRSGLSLLSLTRPRSPRELAILQCQSS